MLKVCLLIYKLDFGGSQRQIVELAKGLADAGHDVTLISCFEGGVFSKDVVQFKRIRYVSLKKKGRWDLPGFLFRFLVQIRSLRPDVLYGFLSLANLLSVLAKLFIPGVRVVWGVRASNLDFEKYVPMIRATFSLECFFSRFSDVVIANSDAGRDYCREVYSFSGEIKVVRNGIDTEFFKPDPEKRIKQRSEWQVNDAVILAGIVGRIDPMKGYPVFIKAAAIVAKKHPDLCFVCVGDGPEDYVLELKELAAEFGISDRVIWSGFKRDMSKVYNALDIFTSASIFGEGFSNVICEAMATGIPCVVTDVGDSALIVGDTGIVVLPDDPVSLASGWEEFLSKKKNINSQKIRKKIVDEFDLKKLTKRTEKILLSD
jgi:glycosyltransferase involved in cell wall biosynthesis